MEKRKLSKIPRTPASDEILRIAKETSKHYVATVEKMEEKILMITFYPVRRLKKGKREAQMRTFFSKDDYITQDLSVEKTKWITASFDMMNCTQPYTYHYQRTGENGIWVIIPNVRFAKIEDHEKTEHFFDEWRSKSDSNEWHSIDRFQDEVKKRRLEEKHAKETEPIDRLMETVGEIPEEFKTWAFEEAMSFSRYLSYQSTEKDIAVVRCSHCEGITVVDRKKIRLRNNEKGNCPMCDSPVTYKAAGRIPGSIYDERYVSCIEPTENGFVWRFFSVWRRIYANAFKEENYLREEARDFYSFSKDGKVKLESYEYRNYKQTGKIRWCPADGRICLDSCILYPNNLPQAWEKTPLKYSALEILSKNNPTVHMNYPRGVRRYLEFPQLEWLIKMGLYKIAKYVIDEIGDGAFATTGTRGLRKNGKTIFEILGLTKENTRLLQKINGDIDALRLLQEAQKSGYHLKADELERFYKLFGCNTTLIRKENRNATIHKICKYIETEGVNYRVGENGECWRYSYMTYKERPDIREERLQNCANDWLDYLEWCKALKYDLNNMFYYFPKNFKAVHDRIAREYQAMQDRKAAAEKRRREAKIKKAAELTKQALTQVFKENGGKGFLIKGKGLLLVVPKDADEIKTEGAALHHCVGTYVERVAKGETNIFFIRKEEEPDVPFFTMEYKNGQVVQCRGSHNCGMPANVKSFVNEFQKKMNAYEKNLEEQRKAG